MKSLKYIALASIIVLASCKKTIELYPESNLNTGTFYSNYDEVSTALTGCYSGMQKTLTEEWTLTELRSDNSIMGVAGSTASGNRDLSDLDMFMPSTSHQGNFSYWASVYTNIHNINLVLNALNVNYSESAGTISYGALSIPVSDANRKALAAEALFLRAYHYFNLTRLYGGVFLIHEPISPEDAKAVNRSSLADMYKLIETDLKEAVANGNTTKFASITTNLGRANAWSAKGLLAKVYLTQNKKAEAITLLQDVIANSGYGLQSSYANIFSITNEMNNEVMFAIRFKAGGLGQGSQFPNLFAPLSSGSNVVNGDGKGLNYPSFDIQNAYQGNDTRKAAAIAVYSGKAYAKKLISSPTVANDAENDWIVLRYADVLLMLAEAQGNTTSSLSLINQTRTRAGLTAILPTAVATTAQFEDSLQRERRYEFTFENQRYFDLMRFNTTMTTINAVQVIKDHFTKEYPLHYIGYPAPKLTLAEMQALVTANKLLLPIPQREIDNNTRIVIPQNQGY
jgi:hypothetical protein